jgi:hypothetical protein
MGNQGQISTVDVVSGLWYRLAADDDFISLLTIDISQVTLEKKLGSFRLVMSLCLWYSMQLNY